MIKKILFLLATIVLYSNISLSKNINQNLNSIDDWIKLDQLHKKRKQKYNELKEKYLIDLWIAKECRNPYGDEWDKEYPKNCPLFRNGFTSSKHIDRYEYINKKYPNKPWRKKIKSNNNY